MCLGADSTGNKQQIKRHNTPLLKINGDTVSLSSATESQKITLPAQINTAVAASNTNLKVDNGKPSQLDMMAKPTDGRLVKDGLVFQQNFTIRSFDMGSDFKISTAALMNFLQESSLNHIRSTRLLADGFGSTPQMSARNLIWVICRLQIEVDCYSSWGDVIQIDTRMYESGKNGYGRDWHVRDFKTGKTLTRATGVYLMMDKTTRKLSKFIEKAREELKPFTSHCDPIVHNNNSKLLKLDIDKANHVRTGLIPGWTDIDINQHVSNIKYINYVLESIPHSVAESHELFTITLEYRKECNMGNVLQSFSRIISSNNEGMEFDHLLCLEIDIGKPRQLDMMAKPTDGRLVKDGLVFQQNFTIRSFVMGSDFKISTAALMNFLQESSLNHIRSTRLLADGFGSTPQMSARNLIWVICRLQIEVDCYSSWGDVIQIDTWMYESGTNGYGRDWHVQDFKTGKTLTRATRKLLKLDIDKANHVRTGLIPGWTDIDINQHVSNIKYINYVLESCNYSLLNMFLSIPHSVAESHELFAITLEYRKECNMGNVLQSFSRIISSNNEGMEFDHLLCLESGQEIMRARTAWRLKYADSSIEKV
ncbi:hypothetical protein Ddye_011256 [Dipteronia dyeriana]|uniref:Acyl-[acyl-carrier-protein] hydrolase n=1 Tax=Dipteronia dyeriana TaxID=168575 RepID=A0AAD9UC51_9ROSI|nr:hypothetical protein Ddye_011256 [Dipteronia dyeriana]